MCLQCLDARLLKSRCDFFVFKGLLSGCCPQLLQPQPDAGSTHSHGPEKAHNSQTFLQSRLRPRGKGVQEAKWWFYDAGSVEKWAEGVQVDGWTPQMLEAAEQQNFLASNTCFMFNLQLMGWWPYQPNCGIWAIYTTTTRRHSVLKIHETWLVTL